MDFNENVFKGNWQIMKGKIHQQWGKITDDEIAQMKGSATELQGILQKKYGYTEEAAKQEIETFLHSNRWDH